MQKHWYVMRDLKRSNSKLPAYKQLANLKFEVFTPMHWKLIVAGNKKIPMEVPFIQDLLFVHDTREKLDIITEKIPTLQYRYQRTDCGHVRTQDTHRRRQSERLRRKTADSQRLARETYHYRTTDMAGGFH